MAGLDDGSGPFYLVAVIAGLIGPFVALAGLYDLERAGSEQRSANRGRTLVVAGTVGIALLSGALFWTIIGPLIAVAILVYWGWKIPTWKREAGPSPKGA